MYYGNTFDFISPATKVCLLSQNNSAEQSQKAVMFTLQLQVSRYCLSDFQGRFVIRVPSNSLYLWNCHDTMCVQAHLNVYYSDGQMLPALAQNCNLFSL